MDTILHMAKSYFSFNHLYVIESLDEKDGDILTGTKLLHDLKPYAQRQKVSTSLITVESAKHWFDAMCFLRERAMRGQNPIIHFEIHGTDSKNGLYLKNGEVIEWPDVMREISAINYACGCNLFVSFAVCYGQYLTQYIKAFRLMPFCVSLGSFEELYEEDLEVRFFAFYKELLLSLDVNKAFQALLNVKEDMPSHYTPIYADVLFARVYKEYLEKECTQTALERRAIEAMKSAPDLFQGMTEQEVQQYVVDFCKCERDTREKDYEEGCEVFFNLRNQPENKERFLIYPTIKALLEAFN